MERAITTRIPEEVLNELRIIAEKENIDTSTVIRKFLARSMKEWKKDYALEKYKTGEFSFGQAARFAEINVMDFPEVLKQKKIPLNLDEEELEAELKTIKKMKP